MSWFGNFYSPALIARSIIHGATTSPARLNSQQEPHMTVTHLEHQTHEGGAAPYAARDHRLDYAGGRRIPGADLQRSGPTPDAAMDAPVDATTSGARPKPVRNDPDRDDGSLTPRADAADHSAT
jgi:hypothetical protein